MAAWSVFYPDVRVHVPSAPTPAVDMALCRAARELCLKSLIWKAWLACTETSSGSGIYNATLPTDSTPVRFDQATVGSTVRDITPFHWHERDWETWESMQPDGISTADFVSLTITGASVTDDVQVQFSLMPSRAAASFPTHLAERFLETVAAGAARNLLLQAGAPWYDPQKASVPAGMFRDGLGRAISAAGHGLTKRTGRPAVRWC